MLPGFFTGAPAAYRSQCKFLTPEILFNYSFKLSKISGIRLKPLTLTATATQQEVGSRKVLSDTRWVFYSKFLITSLDGPVQTDQRYLLWALELLRHWCRHPNDRSQVIRLMTTKIPWTNMARNGSRLTVFDNTWKTPNETKCTSCE